MQDAEYDKGAVHLFPVVAYSSLQKRSFLLKHPHSGT